MISDKHRSTSKKITKNRSISPKRLNKNPQSQLNTPFHDYKLTLAPTDDEFHPTHIDIQIPETSGKMNGARKSITRRNAVDSDSVGAAIDTGSSFSAGYTRVPLAAAISQFPSPRAAREPAGVGFVFFRVSRPVSRSSAARDAGSTLNQLSLRSNGLIPRVALSMGAGRDFSPVG